MLDWYVRHFPSDAYSTIGEIQRQTHTTWNAPAADTLSAVRSALSLDGKLTEQQRQTYFALLEPHEGTDCHRPQWTAGEFAPRAGELAAAARDLRRG